MKKLRVAVFNTQPPHLYLGGVERRILETGKRLGGEVDFTVYSGTKAGFREPAVVNGISVVPCSSTDRLFPLDNWTFNRTLRKMAGTLNADVYESHAVSGYGFQKALIKKGIKTPFIQTVHGVLGDEYAQAQLRGGMSARGRLANFFMRRLAEIEKQAAQNADLVVTISKYSEKKTIDLYRVNPARIRIVPNGVDPERFKPAADADCTRLKERLGVGDRQMVLFVGRLIPRKGLPYLIEAAKTIVKERSETLFVIAGDGPLKSKLAAEVKQANLARNFAFVGDVSEADLPLLYGCADVFAFPSIQEGQGIALLEAQACAKPVVAFNLSGVNEAVVDQETGLLVKPESDELSHAILRLLGNESLRQKMGNAGRTRITNELTWDICAQKMLSVYREAAGKI